MDLASVALKYPEKPQVEIIDSKGFQEIINRYEEIINKINILDEIVSLRWGLLKTPEYKEKSKNGHRKRWLNTGKTKDEEPIKEKTVIVQEDKEIKVVDKEEFIFASEVVYIFGLKYRHQLHRILKTGKLPYTILQKNKFAFKLDDVMEYGINNGLIDESRIEELDGELA